MTKEEIEKINGEYEAQLKEDYEEHIKEILVGIELFNKNNHDTRRNCKSKRILRKM